VVFALPFVLDSGEEIMANRRKKNQSSQSALQEFVTVAFAEDVQSTF